MSTKVKPTLLSATIAFNQVHSANSDVQLATKLLSLQLSAYKRGIQFDMSLKKLKQLNAIKNCYYTGTPFTNKDDSFSRTIDRVDNNLGYVDSNVVVCCAFFNRMKGNLDLKQIAKLAKGVKKHQEKLKKASIRVKQKSLKIVNIQKSA